MYITFRFDFLAEDPTDAAQVWSPCMPSHVCYNHRIQMSVYRGCKCGGSALFLWCLSAAVSTVMDLAGWDGSQWVP
jgi:hypothetical protein